MVQIPKSSEVHQVVTDQIIYAIEKGVGNWKMPWHQTEVPINVKTGRSYGWINSVYLWASSAAHDFESNIWGTSNQWESKGAKVQNAELQKPTVAVKLFTMPKRSTRNNGRDDNEVDFVQKPFLLYNVNQIVGYRNEVSSVEDTVRTVKEVEKFVKNTKAKIKHQGDRAYYDPRKDRIYIPERHKFFKTGDTKAEDNYYCTLLHELIHWTGNKVRCDRPFGKEYGDKIYSNEELVAELGSAFLCAELRVVAEPSTENAAYIKYWLQQLRADKEYIFRVAKRATQAINYLKKLVK